MPAWPVRLAGASSLLFFGPIGPSPAARRCAQLTRSLSSAPNPEEPAAPCAVVVVDSSPDPVEATAPPPGEPPTQHPSHSAAALPSSIFEDQPTQPDEDNNDDDEAWRSIFAKRMRGEGAVDPARMAASRIKGETANDPTTLAGTKGEQAQPPEDPTAAAQSQTGTSNMSKWRQELPIAEALAKTSMSQQRWTPAQTWNSYRQPQTQRWSPTQPIMVPMWKQNAQVQNPATIPSKVTAAMHVVNVRVNALREWHESLKESADQFQDVLPMIWQELRKASELKKAVEENNRHRPLPLYEPQTIRLSRPKYNMIQDAQCHLATKVVVIDTIDALETCLMDLAGSMTLYISARGHNLSRHGTLDLLTIVPCQRQVVYVLAVHKLGKDAFDHTTIAQDGSAVSLRHMLDSEKWKKRFWDLRCVANALFWLYDVNLVNVLDLQVLEAATRPPFESHIPSRRSYELDAAVRFHAQLVRIERDWYQIARTRSAELISSYCNGDSSSIWRQSPIMSDLLLDCALDVRYLLCLETLYTSRLHGKLEPYEIIAKASRFRVWEAQQDNWQLGPNSNQREIGPWIPGLGGNRRPLFDRPPASWSPQPKGPREFKEESESKLFKGDQTPGNDRNPDLNDGQRLKRKSKKNRKHKNPSIDGQQNHSVGYEQQQQQQQLSVSGQQQIVEDIKESTSDSSDQQAGILQNAIDNLRTRTAWIFGGRGKDSEDTATKEQK